MVMQKRGDGRWIEGDKCEQVSTKGESQRKRTKGSCISALLKSMYMIVNTHIHVFECVFSNRRTHIQEGDSRGIITVSFHCAH